MNKTTFLFMIAFFIAQNISAQTGLKGEFIFPLQDEHAHSSSIVETPEGDLLVCWFQGSGERTANDVRVNGARWKNGAKSWSPVFLMGDTYNLPDCNPVLFIDRQQKLWMFWIAVQANRWERSLLKYRTSVDYEGAGAPNWNWQDVMTLQPGDAFAKTIQEGFKALNKDEGIWAEYALPFTELVIEAAKDPVKRQTGWMTRTHPLTLPSGRILLPLYSDGYNLSMVAFSDDRGKTWHASKPIVGFGPNQPSIVRKNDGTLVAYMRDDGDAPYRVLKCTSADDGETWTWARDTDIPNPGSSLEAIRLKNGHWLMVYNDTEDGRYSLAVSLSDDEGATWHWTTHLERVEKGKGSFAYPSVIQTQNGRIHVTYSYSAANGKQTIKHVSFSEKWIKQ